MHDQIIGAIRVGVASLAGALLVWLAQWAGVEISEDSRQLVIAGLTVVATVGYYGLVRLASKWFPNMEWLLGVGRSPVFVKTEHLALAKRNTETLV